MTREMIIKELQNRGYNAKLQNSIKNGVELEGICILTNTNIAPVIYTEAIIENAERENISLDEVVSAIVDIYENHKTLNFDINMLRNKDSVLNSIYIGLQKTSNEIIEKRECDLEGIESYIYIRIEADTNEDEFHTVKISKEFLDNLNISVSEAWERAEANTNEETTLETMAEVMANLLGLLGYDYNEEMDEDEETPVFVLSNKCKNKGASAILNKRVLKEFGKKYHTERIIMLPSSIHETLLIPYTGQDIETFSEMVCETNNMAVDPIERLTDRAYIITI